MRHRYSLFAEGRWEGRRLKVAFDPREFVQQGGEWPMTASDVVLGLPNTTTSNAKEKLTLILLSSMRIGTRLPKKTI
jgi:hypothetical protein